MAAITIYSDFGAPQYKIWHCFHCFPIYFPLSDKTFLLEDTKLVTEQITPKILGWIIIIFKTMKKFTETIFS